MFLYLPGHLSKCPFAFVFRIYKRRSGGQLERQWGLSTIRLKLSASNLIRRTKKSGISDHRIQGFRITEDSVHAIVSPVDSPKRIFSMDGRTMFTAIRCESKMIAF